ncbi:MAG TPA: HDIG domain-containing protein [Acidimicrobiia bacterium]
MQRSTLVRIAIFLATVVAAWGVLSLGSGSDESAQAEGEVAAQDYIAERSASVEDVIATQRLEQDARESVDKPYFTDTDVEQVVYDSVRDVFDDIRGMELTEAPGGSRPTLPTLPETTTSTAEDEESTTTTEETEPAVVTGRVFLDANGNGAFDSESEERNDIGLAEVTVSVTTQDGNFNVVTDGDGIWSAQYDGGAVVVEMDAGDAEIPDGFVVGTDNPGQLLECISGETCEAEDIGLEVQLRPVDEVAERIATEHDLPNETAAYLAAVATEDVVRAAFGEPQLLTVIEAAAVDRVTLEFGRRIQPEQLQDAQRSVENNPPQVVFNSEIVQEAGAAAGEIVSSRLQANYRVNEEEYQRLQEAEANQVEPVMRDIAQGETIVTQGQRLSAFDIAAIDATSAPTFEEQPANGVVAVVAVLVGLLGLYLATFRPEFWARPRMVALLGIIIVLAAASVRGTVALEDSFGWYVLPAVAFGFVTAVLFDQRIAVLVALAVGVLTAVGTLDPGVTVYGMLAALAPIPFVSSVSSRGAFRNAVVLSSLVAAAVAASTAWFFQIGANETFFDVVPISVAWAFGVSIFASLLGLAALQFFESAFDITTTLGLLDLTDRNHDALQMLQEKAFGTFNHSLMVGTLAHAAARSIGANALLARAMAYYHDLGKTENPTFFIENQFGMTNPHDELDPKESAQIVRDHVTAGVGLARDYKIPTDVTEGIVSHHGDGVMRFFFEKARRIHGDNVDIDDFRHIGHKPRTAESAILMLADSLEAACRAVFQSEEPTPDAIEKVVDRVMNEKMEDDQLSESPLTLGELTKVRRAFLDSLIGHYHQRIPYPNFPGS